MARDEIDDAPAEELAPHLVTESPPAVLELREEVDGIKIRMLRRDHPIQQGFKVLGAQIPRIAIPVLVRVILHARFELRRAMKEMSLRLEGEEEVASSSSEGAVDSGLRESVDDPGWLDDGSLPGLDDAGDFDGVSVADADDGVVFCGGGLEYTAAVALYHLFDFGFGLLWLDHFGHDEEV